MSFEILLHCFLKKKAKASSNGECCVVRWNRAKLSLAQRKDRVAQKKASFLRAQEQEVSD